MDYILPFDKISLNKINIVGGKSASLGEMYNNLSKSGINVPWGFGITTNAYSYFIKHNNLHNKINDLLSILNTNDNKNNRDLLKHTGSKIRKCIIESEFPAELKDYIEKWYNIISNRYCDSSGNLCKNIDVAVRSSSTAEDLDDSSFAGQQETFLNVRYIDNLLLYIKKCYASLYSDRVISYRIFKGYDNSNVKMGVCIQKMVRSDIGSAGVAFSIDSDSGFKNAIIINSSWGLGEIIVGGKVKPDEFILYKSGLENGYNSIIDKKIGEKSHKIIYNDKSIIQIECSEKELNSFSLDNENILTLGEQVIKIEKYFSEIKGRECPVDIEWALDGITKKLYIVQARPETVQSIKKDADIMLEEYSFSKNNNDNNNRIILAEGIAVGSKISNGKIKIIESLDLLEKGDISFNTGDILVTDITDPSWVPLMKISGGVITNRGGRTCHASIVARELGISAIVGTINATDVLKDNEMVTISCAEGSTGYVYKGKLDFDIKYIDVSKYSDNKIFMLNVGSPEIAFSLHQYPAAGVGLVREEFIISNFIKIHPLALLNKDSLNKGLQDKIDYHIRGYNTGEDYFINKLAFGISRIASVFNPKPIIVRFSDFKSNEYSDLIGGEIYEPKEENPMLGWRGASRYYSKEYEEAFGMECKAILKARNEYGLTNIIVMIPFCRTPKECQKVLETMAKYGLRRGENGLKVYIMCEIPSNVILADEFCKYVDGFSIGSNDLTQLTLGLDRDSELIQHIYDERNEAVKIMIRQAIKTCKKNGVKIGICGQAPSDFPDFADFLLDEKIDSISLTPDSFFKTLVRHRA